MLFVPCYWLLSLCYLFLVFGDHCYWLLGLCYLFLVFGDHFGDGVAVGVEFGGKFCD